MHEFFMNGCDKEYRLTADFGQNSMPAMSSRYAHADHHELDERYHGQQRKVIETI
tara:strand:- start:1741 stop:1905 length:165 start_codon:yes stop_codon:yes gene_type:complete